MQEVSKKIMELIDVYIERAKEDQENSAEHAHAILTLSQALKCLSKEVK